MSENIIVKKKRGRKPKVKVETKNEIKSEEIKSEEIKSEEIKSEEIKSEEIKSEEIKVPKKRGRKPKPKTAEELATPKIPKKRGRKPKPKVEQEVKIPKKRGRKPKDRYKVTEKSNIINSINEENIILHLPISSNKLNNIQSIENDMLKYNPTLTEPKPYDPENETFINSSINQNVNVEDENIKNNKLKIVIDYKDKLNNKENSNDDLLEDVSINESNEINEINEIKEKYDEILNDYNKKRNIDISSNSNQIGKSKSSLLFYQYNECNKNQKWPCSSNINCLWDFNKFSGKPYGLPIKKVGNVVYMTGNFCSPQCAAAYNFSQNDQSDEIWERYSLLNWLYSDELENPNDTIKIAASHLTLKENGGTLSIEEFRKLNKNKSKDYKIVYPPVISLIPVMEEINLDVKRKKNFAPIDKEIMDKANEEFKLKRTKPLPNYKNTLESCMLLKYV